MDSGGRATQDAKAEKHHIRLSLEARWPRTSKPRDLMGRVNDAVAYDCMDAGGRATQESKPSESARSVLFYGERGDLFNWLS